MIMNDDRYYVEFQGTEEGLAEFLFFVGDDLRAGFARPAETVPDGIEAGDFLYAELRSADGHPVEYDPETFHGDLVEIGDVAPEMAEHMEKVHAEAINHHEQLKELARERREDDSSTTSGQGSQNGPE